MDLPERISFLSEPPVQARALPVIKERIADEPDDGALVGRVEDYLRLAKEATGTQALALVGFPDLREARLAVLGARQSGLPLYVLLEADEEGETRGGDSLLACLVCLQELGIAGLAAQLPADSTEPPVWLDELAAHTKISLFAGHIGSLRPVEAKSEIADELVLCGAKAVYYLDEDFTATEPIPCEPGLSEAILEAEDQGCDLLLFHVETVEDAEYLGERFHMALDAVGFLAEGEEALEAALLHYPGRALVDARSDVPEDRMRFLAEGYGAMIR